MKDLLLPFLLFLSWVQVGAQSFPEQLIAGAMLVEAAVEEGDCIGVAAGFSVGGECAWAHGAGWRDADQELPFESATPTRIASIVKPMTAVAVLQLVEQGKVDLDAPIQQYVPNFPVKPEGEITVRTLLTHSSGIGGYESNKERQNKVQYESLAAAATVFQDRDLLFTPGEDFNYTTYGYVVLGMVIEAVSGMSYEAYLRANIWEMAGMEDTGVEVIGAVDTGSSELYHKGKKKIKAAERTNLSDRIPGGGIYSTVTDVLKFGDALLGGQLLSSESMELMWTNTGLKQEGNAYGMGWYLYGENPNYGPVVGHTGGQTGVSGMLMILPEVGTTIVVLSNTSGSMQRVSNIAVQLFELAAACE